MISTQKLHKNYINVTYRKTTTELQNNYRKTTENPQYSPPVNKPTSFLICNRANVLRVVIYYNNYACRQINKHNKCKQEE